MLNKRLRLLMEENNLSQADLAKKLNISSAYVSQLLSGTKTNISRKLGIAISNIFNVNYDWIKSGEGEMRNDIQLLNYQRYGSSLREAGVEFGSNTGGTTSISPIISEINDDFVKVNVYKVVYTGKPDTIPEFQPVDTIVLPKRMCGPDVISLKVYGDSMEKLIMDGSVISVDIRQRELVDKKIYCFRIPWAGIIIRMVHTELDGLVLEPFNNEYESITFKWDEFDPDCVVGRVICNVINVFK